ncbi:MAG: Stp1/IreP family PP2C-type Ser/Thr phosphatase [Myxococcota bacterium]
MILRTAANSDVGLRRRGNEDCFAVEPGLGLCLVADGMGGHSAGQVASALASEAVVTSIREQSSAAFSLTEKLRRAVQEANRTIWEAARERRAYAGMGTTVVALLMEGGRAGLAHVGDSRAYRVRDGAIRQLSDDHSVVGELLRRHEITEDAAREHPHRHVLTRALGVRGEVEADLAELTPEPGDLFVLCSDGLTNHVEDHEIAKLSLEIPDLDECCDALIELANRRGGEDNTTVVLSRCESSER